MNVFLMLGFFFQKKTWLSISRGVLVWAFGQEKKYFHYLKLAVAIVSVKKEFLTVNQVERRGSIIDTCHTINKYNINDGDMLLPNSFLSYSLHNFS